MRYLTLIAPRDNLLRPSARHQVRVGFCCKPRSPPLPFGDYFRVEPKTKDKRRTWYCPALEQKVKIEGTPNAYNSSAWVETDAVNSMLYYLSSGDFFRM